MPYAIIMPLGEMRGGVERMLMNLLRANRTQPRAEYAVAFLQDGPLVEDVRALGYRADVFTSGRLRQPIRYARTVGALCHWLREIEAEAVLSWAAKGHLYAGPAARLLGVPASWYVHSLPSGTPMERLITAIPASLVLCCGRTAERAQQRVPPSRATRVAYISVDLSDFDPDNLPDPREARRQLGLSTGGGLVVMVARLQRWKGVHIFVDAAARLRAEHPDVHFVVVGGEHWAEPEYPADLDAQVASLGLGEYLHFVGLQQNVPLWMQAADVVVHASFEEPTGTVIIEAMALGKAVVAARSGGPMEFVEEGVCGLLADAGDAEELATALDRLLRDPEERERFGVEARKRTRYFSADRLAADIAEAMASIARTTPTPT